MENLRDPLRRRAAHLPPLIPMCVALSRNLPNRLQAIVAHWLAHRWRQFVDVAEPFSQEFRQVLELLSGSRAIQTQPAGMVPRPRFFIAVKARIPTVRHGDRRGHWYQAFLHDFALITSRVLPVWPLE